MPGSRSRGPASRLPIVVAEERNKVRGLHSATRSIQSARQGPCQSASGTSSHVPRTSPKQAASIGRDGRPPFEVNAGIQANAAKQSVAERQEGKVGAPLKHARPHFICPAGSISLSSAHGTPASRRYHRCSGLGGASRAAGYFRPRLVREPTPTLPSRSSRSSRSSMLVPIVSIAHL